MSVTLEPTGSTITGSLSSIISPTASIISSNISSIIASTTSSQFTSTTTTSTSSAEASTTKCVSKGIDFCFDGANYLNDAKHAANIGSQFSICVVVGIIFFLIFCIFRTR